MAELGFIVVMVDGRGTTGRSRVFHQFSYRNLGGVFEDHVALIKQMAERYPYMDLSRVGIYGTSAGGYGAAHAMLVFPDFYKVGVTISGDHDARLDKRGGTSCIRDIRCRMTMLRNRTSPWPIT
jgi:dipeptidyl-peptidase 4